MKSTYFLSVIIIILFGSCSPWKETMVTDGNQNDAVQNAIIDFLNTNRLSEKNTVYSIHVQNVNDNLLGVSILENCNKLLPNVNTKIGSLNGTLPTRYIEKNGALFYWDDSTYVLTEDMVSKLSQYKIIDSLNVKGFVGIHDGNYIDDSKKGVDYYICKSNFLKYKKVRTSTAMGWYTPPKLGCN